MDTRDMFETQVELLTRHCRTLSDQVDQLEERLTYFENVVATLLIALKDAKIIVDADESSDLKTYEC